MTEDEMLEQCWTEIYDRYRERGASEEIAASHADASAYELMRCKLYDREARRG